MTNEMGKQGVAVGSQIIRQPPEINEMGEESGVTQRWLLFGQRTEPTKEMAVAMW